MSREGEDRILLYRVITRYIFECYLRGWEVKLRFYDNFILPTGRIIDTIYFSSLSGEE